MYVCSVINPVKQIFLVNKKKKCLNKKTKTKKQQINDEKSFSIINGVFINFILNNKKGMKKKKQYQHCVIVFRL